MIYLLSLFTTSECSHKSRGHTDLFINPFLTCEQNCEILKLLQLWGESLIPNPERVPPFIFSLQLRPQTQNSIAVQSELFQLGYRSPLRLLFPLSPVTGESGAYPSYFRGEGQSILGPHTHFLHSQDL